MININEEELQCKICYEFLYETVLCSKCSNAFCQECAINYKKKAKKYGRVDKCPICGVNNFTFQRCEEIDKLIKKRKQKPLQCQHCKRIIFDKEKYEEHIKECKYQCKFCLMMFDKEDDLLRHIKKNNEELFKALDLMNFSRNKIKYYNEEKPKKKKIIKRKTKEIINNEIKDDKKEEKINEKINDKINEKIDEKIKETKNEEKGDINEKNTSKKIIKKKIIKKKKKIVKKKEHNTINFYDNNNINEEEDLIKNKINKKNIEDEDKLNTENKKLNISTDINKNENMENIITNNEMETSENMKINNNKITNNKTNKNQNDINISKAVINSNINKNKNEEILEDFKIENINKKKENQEDSFEIKSKNIKSEKLLLKTEQKNINEQIIEEEEKVNRYVDYLNNPKPESNKPSTIPGEAKYNPEYDLFFCGKPNHIDCICCTDHKCKPGACMCISCMKLNKKYHKLKSHYLINKSGRACKYSHGYFHCYCNYTHIVHDVGNNIFKPVYRCQGENICKPCEEITLLMETYLPNTICQKLRDRETKQAQF